MHPWWAQTDESQQAVEEKEKSTWEKKAVTLVPDIESVSSTAMVMQVQRNSIVKNVKFYAFSYFFKSQTIKQVKILAPSP